VYINHFILYSFQFYWGKSRSDLPATAVDAYRDFPRFLRILVAWIQSRRMQGGRCKRNGRAITVIKKNKVLPGSGVYTLTELFHDCGEPYLLPMDIKTESFNLQDFHLRLLKPNSSTTYPVFAGLVLGTIQSFTMHTPALG
jgi:hypothetical protein